MPKMELKVEMKKLKERKKRNPIAACLKYLPQQVVPNTRNKILEEEREKALGDAYTSGYDEVERLYED